MKRIFLLILAVPTLIFSSEGKNESMEAPLKGFQNFEVMTFVVGDEKEQNKIYESIIASFKELGQVTVLDSDSRPPGLFQSVPTKPLCLFRIGEDDISLKVLTEVQATANKLKTTCSIWEKEVEVLSIEGSEQMEGSDQIDCLAIAKSAERVIKKFSEDCLKANQTDSKRPTFHIRIHKGI
jgi:hypothetical protein